MFVSMKKINIGSVSCNNNQTAQISWALIKIKGIMWS
jgi:hypothetical protein